MTDSNTGRYPHGFRSKGLIEHLQYGKNLSHRIYSSTLQALQHMLHKSGYNYPKNVETTVGVRLVSGKGILWASGMCYHVWFLSNGPKHEPIRWQDILTNGKGRS